MRATVWENVCILLPCLRLVILKMWSSVYNNLCTMEKHTHKAIHMAVKS